MNEHTDKAATQAATQGAARERRGGTGRDGTHLPLGLHAALLGRAAASLGVLLLHRRLDHLLLQQLPHTTANTNSGRGTTGSDGRVK
jgi:hypothetical protein